MLLLDQEDTIAPLCASHDCTVQGGVPQMFHSKTSIWFDFYQIGSPAILPLGSTTIIS